MATIVVGGHFGDEGKGKIVSYLACEDNPEIVARAGVGPNAGHTVYKNGKEYGLRMVTCGFVNPESELLIGPGVLVDPDRFLKEVQITETEKRIKIDRKCAIIEEKHRQEDQKDSHLSDKIGSTGSGSGPANAERAHRSIKLAREIPELENYLTDVPREVNQTLDNDGDVLVEASQGFGLSLFHGTYPFVTSKDTSASMAAVDIGLGPKKVEDVMVIYKAYTTRVGEGPLDTEIDKNNIKEDELWQNILDKAKEEVDIEENQDIQDILAEYLGEKGTVTGRQRRVGKFDYSLAQYSSMVNSASQIGITCLDKLFPKSFEAQEYDDLPADAQEYVQEIEDKVGVKATLLSTGPKSEDVIDLR